jgi:hypothetical protein
MHTGDSNEGRASRAKTVVDGSAEPKIGDGRTMPSRLEGGGNVFHAERLDAKEWTKPEAIVPWDGAQE